MLRFSGSHLHDPAVAAWFDAKPAALAALVRPWWMQLRACGLDVSECIHDGCPVVCIDDAPFGYVNIFSAHAAVGFFHGASLPDPSGILTGTGTYMRHVKLRPGRAVDARALEALNLAAFEDIQHRLAHEDRRPQKARTIAASTPRT